MKKLLAIILAVAMIAAIIPAASATETSGEEPEIKIVCDLGNLLKGYTNGTTPFSQLNTDSNGVFKYITSCLESDKSVADGKVGTAKALSGTAAGNIAYAGGAANQYHLRMYKGAYISFEVNVPETGKYSLDVVSQKNTNGMIVDVYVTPAAQFYAQGTFSKQNLGTASGSLNCNGGTIANITSGGPWETMNAFKDVYLSAGRYVITFFGTATPKDRAPLNTFTLYGNPVEEEPEVTSKEITYNVAKVMRDNSIFYAVGQDGRAEAKKITYKETNGLFEVIDARGTITVGGNGATAYNFFKIAKSATIDFKVNIPEDGKYMLYANHQIANEGAPVSVYVDGKKAGEYNCYSKEEGVPAKFASGATAVWKNDVLVTKNGIDLSAGEHTLSFMVQTDGYGTISYFELVNEEIKANSVSLVYVDKSTLEVDETATISGAVVSSFDGVVKAESDASAVYESSDSSVVKVNGTTITAVAPGVADITITLGGVVAKRTIYVLDEKVSGNVSFVAIGDGVTVSGVGDYTVGNIASVELGTEITVTATDKAGLEFLGWYRGSKDNGVWLTDELTYSIKLMTNTYLTAVYETVSNNEGTVDVTFYNGNGQFIEKKTAAVGTDKLSSIAPTATMTGFKFLQWTTQNGVLSPDDTFAKASDVVAEYEDSDERYTVDGDSGYKYDEVIDYVSSNGDVTWYLNGKAVAYGSSYKYRVWSNANVTSKSVVTNGPIIALDANITDGARMISYDANGTEIVEVGILFGKSSTVTSFDAKAASKARGDVCGQFTANADTTEARGYLIYNDDGVYRVIYAD